MAVLRCIAAFFRQSCQVHLWVFGHLKITAPLAVIDLNLCSVMHMTLHVATLAFWLHGRAVTLQ